MLPPGTRLGPYEIVAPLGRGGMGEVYRARDHRLDRDVAIKIVSQTISQDTDLLRRFEREAKAVAALAHPNILVLYDVGHEQGVPFAVTELLEGMTLRERLSGEPLSWREAFAIGAAVADGLAAAHAKGIIHRDLKPGNLFLTSDGRVKILDFGLARLESPPPDQSQTATYLSLATDTGVVVGTMGYMSPEQLRGRRADARSDLFSLGCVLYQLVCGRRPFQRDTAADTTAAILHDDPAPAAACGVTVPAEVEGILLRCLAKEAAARFPSARALADALRAALNSPESGTTTARRRAAPRRRRETIPSLAVLPLVNSSAQADSDYLSDGITESIIQSLSELPGLRVMARSTVFRYKGRDLDAQAVGRALKVRAVLSGELVERGNRVLLKTELVDVKSGARLWGETYERPLAEIITLEKAVAHDIAAKLRLRLTRDEQRRLEHGHTRSAEAYQCYLQGRYHWNKRTETGLKKSIKLFEEAIDRDPTYALAYSGIADAYVNLGGWGCLPFHDAYPRGKAAAQHALAIDPNLAEAHASLAIALKEYDWDWPAAGQEYQRALELKPAYASAHEWYGEYLAALGRHDEAIAAMQRALELEPLSLIMHATLGRHGYYFARRYEESVAQLQRTLDMDENFWVAHHFLAITYAKLGRLEDALAEIAAAAALTESLEIIAVRGYVHGLAGRRAQAEEAFAELEQHRRTRYVSRMLSAIVAIGMGEHELAFACLEKGYVDGSQIFSEIGVEAMFDTLRGDPRWADLMRRVRLIS